MILYLKEYVCLTVHYAFCLLTYHLRFAPTRQSNRKVMIPLIHKLLETCTHIK